MADDSAGCDQCGRPIAAAPTGRPRRYCSAACRQRSYRARAASTRDLGALATRVRDNADLLRLICQGWHPPAGEDATAVITLLTDTAALSAEFALRCRAWASATGARDESGESPDRRGLRQ